MFDQYLQIIIRSDELFEYQFTQSNSLSRHIRLTPTHPSPYLASFERKKQKNNSKEGDWSEFFPPSLLSLFLQKGKTSATHVYTEKKKERI